MFLDMYAISLSRFNYSTVNASGIYSISWEGEAVAAVIYIQLQSYLAAFRIRL